jgi:hypothetical protein
MSGEYWNNELFIDDYTFYDKGWTDQSLSNLFDFDGDGEVSGVEVDRATSLGLINTLNSINPIVARAYSEENFFIQTGLYLTQEQKANQEKWNNVIERVLKELEEDKYKKKIRIEEENLNILNINEPIEQTTLQEDLKDREYLEGGEIDNQV